MSNSTNPSGNGQGLQERLSAVLKEIAQDSEAESVEFRTKEGHSLVLDLPEDDDLFDVLAERICIPGSEGTGKRFSNVGIRLTSGKTHWIDRSEGSIETAEQLLDDGKVDEDWHIFEEGLDPDDDEEAEGATKSSGQGWGRRKFLMAIHPRDSTPQASLLRAAACYRAGVTFRGEPLDSHKPIPADRIEDLRRDAGLSKNEFWPTMLQERDRGVIIGKPDGFHVVPEAVASLEGELFRVEAAIMETDEFPMANKHLECNHNVRLLYGYFNIRKHEKPISHGVLAQRLGMSLATVKRKRLEMTDAGLLKRSGSVKAPGFGYVHGHKATLPTKRG